MMQGESLAESHRLRPLGRCLLSSPAGATPRRISPLRHLFYAPKFFFQLRSALCGRPTHPPRKPSRQPKPRMALDPITLALSILLWIGWIVAMAGTGKRRMRGWT